MKNYLSTSNLQIKDNDFLKISDSDVCTKLNSTITKCEYCSNTHLVSKGYYMKKIILPKTPLENIYFI